MQMNATLEFLLSLFASSPRVSAVQMVHIQQQVHLSAVQRNLFLKAERVITETSVAAPCFYSNDVGTDLWS